MRKIVSAGAIAIVISSSVFAQSDTAFVLSCATIETKGTSQINGTISVTIDLEKKEYTISSGRRGRISQITSTEYILEKDVGGNTYSHIIINRMTGSYHYIFDSRSIQKEVHGSCYKTNAPVPKPKF